MTRMEEIKNEISQIRAFINAVGEMDPEAVNSAFDQLNELKEELKSLTKTETVKSEKKAVEPIGKPSRQPGKVDTAKVCNFKRLIEALRNAKIPQEAIDLLIDKYAFEEIKVIVWADLRNELQAIKGIGECRADAIIKTLTGKIDEPMMVKKLTAEVREQVKAEVRERAVGYSCRTYEADELWRFIREELEALKSFKPDYKIPSLMRALEYAEDDERAKEIKKELDKRMRAEAEKVEALQPAIESMKKKIFVKTPMTVRRSQGRIIRLNRSMTADAMKINYEAKTPTDKVMVLHHETIETFNLSWRLFSENMEEGLKVVEELQKNIMNQLGWYGVVAVSKDGSRSVFGVLGSSAGHQKGEKVLMGKGILMKENQKLFWWGKTMEEFAKTSDATGAEIWKARANMLRPWMKPFETKDGRQIKAQRLLVVKDMKKVFKVLNARAIGKDEELFKDKKLWHDGAFDEESILGDGAILSLTELKFQGQCSGALIKGFFADATSAIAVICKKYNISVEEFLNTEVEGIDGKMHRIGDFDAICGEGCWKGDKVFGSYTEYLAWLDEMAKTYEGIDNLYLLRQAEEIEDEEKVRTLTRTLIQQYMWMTGAERLEMTRKARNSLKKGKTFRGAVSKLAALWKDPEERTEVEKLFEECPWLIMSPVIQNYLEESWNRSKVTAMAGKFRTEGQYPYIMQDPVALLEVWVLGKHPDDPNLGILKDGEVSCADVADGRELLLVRFPANFLTAVVRKNRACANEFRSLNGVLVLSVHDIILITQDGDVDGDEMAVIYNRLAIKLVKRMQAKLNPPTILFKHGGKPERSIAGKKEELICRMMESLWKAKKYDSVGLYANLAMKCAYLASIALKNNNQKMVDKWLLYMSVASTGAIIAIDQVKGTTVDGDLIRWLDEISKEVNKAMKAIGTMMGYQDNKMINPFIQYFVAMAKRKPIEINSCLPANEDNFLDMSAQLIDADVGEWKDFDSQGVVWNSIAAEEALTSGLPRMTVPHGVVTKEMVSLLGDNWFKLRVVEDEADATSETLKKLIPGTKIGLTEFILCLWRNEASMYQIMEGRQLWEKKEEYRNVCRELMKMIVDTGDWSKAPNLSKEDRWNVLVNILVRYALELNLGFNKRGEPVTNSVNPEKKGSFAIFCLALIAPELRRNAKKNRVDQARFFGISIDIKDLLIKDIEDEKAEDEEELFEKAPVVIQEEEPEYRPSDEELAKMAKELFGSTPDNSGELPDEIPDLPED